MNSSFSKAAWNLAWDWDMLVYLSLCQFILPDWRQVIWLVTDLPHPATPKLNQTTPLPPLPSTPLPLTSPSYPTSPTHTHTHAWKKYTYKKRTKDNATNNKSKLWKNSPKKKVFKTFWAKFLKIDIFIIPSYPVVLCQFEWPWLSFKVTGAQESQNLCSHFLAKFSADQDESIPILFCIYNIQGWVIL